MGRGGGSARERAGFVGVDAGSTAAKLVRFDGRCITRSRVVEAQRLGELLALLREGDVVCSTGYFRRRVPHRLTITEITAARLGVAHHLGDVEVIIDLGGQDTKVIDLRDLTLQMNDRCSAGTGAFLEQAARYLGVSVEGLAALASRARGRVDINSTCSVFALSEMISALERGARREAVAAGLHRALARRIAELVPWAERIAVAGGVALNAQMVEALSGELGRRVLVPPDPQLVNALGAAIHARGALRRARRGPGAAPLQQGSPRAHREPPCRAPLSFLR
ncbi:MAG: acyl-CoA dehydratase activase [Thermoplasmatota archaeon]